MSFLVTRYATTNPDFMVKPPPMDQSIVLVARFMASMQMHLTVENDLTHSLQLMKYAVNHHENFVNPYVSFLFGFISFLIAIHVEINAIIIFSSMTDAMGIVIKYVSIAAIVNIPRYYVSV